MLAAVLEGGSIWAIMFTHCHPLPPPLNLKPPCFLVSLLLQLNEAMERLKKGLPRYRIVLESDI